MVPSTDETGFQPLFNGRDFRAGRSTGVTAPDGAREGGEIVAVGEGATSVDFLVSNHDYRDFTLRFEFKVTENATAAWE